ncbi:MAG TPA: ATP-dependent DNA helicase [Zeimonas sp.]|nr:ATP-dependent DNA helicase [Zeimonas sp.]
MGFAGAASRLAEAVDAAFDADGPIAEATPGYTPRASQRAMARAVAQAIDTAEPLVVEAGTGVGKTYAYLVPALLSGARVLISTGTKTLQDQLFRRDLPRVRQALASGATTALLKGRANYVCRHHLRRNLAEGRFERREDIAMLRRIERFAAISDSGDRSEAQGIPEDAPAWALATSTRENCLGQDCADFAQCFVFRARQAAQAADIVVVNHHLFCADLALRDEGVAELLPSVHAVVFDEAHQLPQVATQFLGRGVSTRQLVEFARDLHRAGRDEALDAADWTSLSSALEHAVRELRLAAGRPGRIDARQARARAALREAIVATERALPREALERFAERGRELARLRVRGDELAARLREWCDGVWAADAGTDEAIHWVDVHAGGLTLQITPLSVADAFRRHRESVRCAWICTSATLSVAGSFDHFTTSLGLEDAHTLCCESPFDYPRQALLYVPRECGDPASPGFAERVTDAAWPLIVANGGRAFVLCTSLRMVEQQATLLAERIAALDCGIELLVQGRASRSALIERFRAAPRPLLVGSASFWEGVDVVGDRLSLVVIDKLPFAAPDDPILAARIEAARRGGRDPFRQMQLPAAAMALKQGAGRLIRSETDRGLLMICDERLATRPYGRRLVASLPAFRRTRDAEEARAFCASLSARPATSDDRLPAGLS